MVDFIQELKDAQFTDSQVKVLARHAEEQTLYMGQVFEDKQFATKNDLDLVKLALQNDIRNTELRLQNEIKNTEIKLMYLYGAGFLVILGTLAKGFGWL